MAIHQPHGHLFRRVFGVPQEAASFLHAQLPPALRRSLRWSTLKRNPASYVTPDLHGAASDLLFEVRYAKPGAARARLWLYLLFEHQSTPDRWMRLRLLDYCCRIWDRDRQDHKNARYLRPILPLVFYQGPTGWRHSPQFADLFPAAVSADRRRLVGDRARDRDRRAGVPEAQAPTQRRGHAKRRRNLTTRPGRGRHG